MRLGARGAGNFWGNLTDVEKLNVQGVAKLIVFILPAEHRSRKKSMRENQVI